MKYSFLKLYCGISLVALPIFTNAQKISENKKLIQAFMDDVRSGKNPQNAKLYLADTVLAHQFNAEDPITVKRTPANYEDHIHEFLKMYGKYSFRLTELIADGDKVYARWEQTGRHIGLIDGFPPTGKPITEYASCVYRIKNKKIVEYWIQIDRFGFEKQLKDDARK